VSTYTILENVRGMTAKLKCGVRKATYVLDEYEETIILKNRQSKTTVALQETKGTKIRSYRKSMVHLSVNNFGA
jgi:hypothetical protein